MHPDDKLANHGKPVSGESGSHISSVNQQTQQQQTVAGHLGPKGGNGIKSNQISPGTRCLKSVSQSASSSAGMLKTKSKRERSVSTDSDMRNQRTSVESDSKAEGIMRSKRRCVLERKQPYSGDEWCSGPDTEEDEDKPQTAIHREKTMIVPVQGLCDLRSLESGSGPGLKVEPKQTSSQLVYVFTTNLANSAADAVLKGQSDSILLFHQQNVPRPKLEQGHPEGKMTPNILEKSRSSSSPLACTNKSQSGTPRPSSAGMTLQAGILPTSGQSDSELTQIKPSTGAHHNTNVTRAEGTSPAGLIRAPRDRETLEGMIHPVSPSQSPTAQSLHHQSAQVPKLCPENLSKEQLEHRERSLQTLRDIERLFLRTAGNTEHGDPESANMNPNNPISITERSSILEAPDTGRTISVCSTTANNNLLSSPHVRNVRKYEEPLQSIISQTQALNGPQIDHNVDHPHHQISSPGMDIGHLLGPEGLTPEQIAWRKLQEDYYQEKRRQQEIQPSTHSQDFRISEMQMHGGPMLRGPPPPYHSKPGEQQWTNNMIGMGVRGNAQLLDIQEGRHGSRFLGQTPRGPPGSGFPGNSGAFPLEGAGHQRPLRPGMPWLDEMPNDTGVGGPFQGLYTSGTVRHMQGNTERLIAREMFRTVGQSQMLRTLRLSKQQQHSNLMSRLIDNPGGPDFSNLVVGRGPPSQNDLLDFPGSRDILGSPGAGPQIKDVVDSPLGSSFPLYMNQSMNLQQQQQMNLAQKLRGPSEMGPLSEIFGQALPQGRPLQSRQGEKMGMNPGPDGSFHFSNQNPFSGGQVEGSYLQTDSEMFEEQGSNQMGGTMRLTHMPMTGGLKGPDARTRHPSDPTLNPLTSPSHPASNQHKSPSEEPVPSPLLPSPSGMGKSPSKTSSTVHQPPLPPASGAGTPSSISMKSPAVVGSSNQGLQSPSTSPGQLKSPVVGGASGSPGWTSPKPALPSPVLTSGKKVGDGGTSEIDQSLPPRSLTSTPITQPGTTNTSAPFTSSPEVPQSQNPLSLIMSQMSKYALPSSTPLYHDAIKTLASSDDEMLPDRPLLSGVSIGGNTGNAQASQLLGPEPQSPIGVMNQSQQQLSHDTSGSMHSSPNQAALSSMNTVMIGGSTTDGIGLCNISPLSQNQMGGFSRLQSSRLLHSPVGEMSQNFNQSNDSIMPTQQIHMISKGLPNQRHPPSDSFGSLRDGPDLSEVIRPTRTGIPEFDLSRIIPCDKPSSILQYFPKADTHQNQSQRPPSQQPSPQLLKQLSSSYLPHNNGSSSNPHIAHLQNMMAEQQLQSPSHNIGRQGMGASRMVSGAGIGPMCLPGQVMGRPSMSLQQQHGMVPNNSLHHSINPYQGIMSSQQHAHNTMAQHNIMMQAKPQGLAIPGDPFGHQGPLLSPQGPMMSLPQQSMMGPQSIRQRGMSLGSPINYGPGSMANMPF